MIPGGIKFAHVALLLFAMLLAFLVLRTADEDITLGRSATVWITQSENSISSTEAMKMIESFAKYRNVNVGREVQNIYDPGNKRNLYLAVGDTDSASGSWIDEGYPNFSRDFRTEVQPLSNVYDLDTRGYYPVFGSLETAEKLLAEFERLGFTGEVVPNPTLKDSVQFFGQGAVLWCFLIAPLAAGLVVGSSVVLNAKAYGVLRLQGKSFLQILYRDMAQLAVFWVRAVVVITASILVVLAFYNGLNQLWAFARITIGFLAVFTAVALFAHVFALALTYRTEIVYAIKGEVSGTLAMVSACALRVPAALLALAIILSALSSAEEVEAYQVSRDAFERVGDASYVEIGGGFNYGEEQSEREMNEALGAWIQEGQQEGEVILSRRTDMLDFTAAGESLPERDVLFVNEDYLAEQTVLDESGKRLRGVLGSGEKAQVFVPGSLSREANKITAEVARNLAFHADRNGMKMNDSHVETVITKSGQTIFTYGSGIDPAWRSDALVRDPVMIFIPDESGIFGWDQYSAYLSQYGVIFKDPDYVREAMSTDVGRYILAVSPVAQNSADYYQELVREFRLDLFNVALALTVLVVTAVSVGLIYRRKNSQTLFIKYISGWPFLKAYSPLLALEAVLSLALVGWVSFATWSRVRAERSLAAEFESQGIPPLPTEAVPLGNWQPAIMLAIAVLGFAVVLVVLATSHAKIHKQRAVEE